MQVRRLRKILNTTRPIADFGNYIAVGSPMCHDLISVDKKTMRISYALDTFRKGRPSVDNKDDLGGIWDQLQKLIDSGILAEIIANDDPITDSCVKVYTYRGGKVIEKYAYEFGWPNSTVDGEMMYKNTHFLTFDDATQRGINEETAAVNSLDRRLKELEERKRKAFEELRVCQENLKSIQSLIK